MDFDWPAELQGKVDAARRFAADKLSGPHPVAGFDADGFRTAAAFGLFDTVAREPGTNRCRGALAAAALLEAMGRGGADRSLLFAMGAHLFGCLVPFATYATPAQAGKWEKILKSGAAIGALAVTEAEGGSSLEGIRTEAIEADGGYALTGEKTLIGNAPQADLFVVLARHGSTPGPLGLTAFLVPADAGGLTVSPMVNAMGLHRAPLGDLRLERCFVPAENVLGRTGAGLRVFSTAMQWERSCLLAGFLGAAERDLALCLEALKLRRDRQGSVLRHQAVSHRLARMALNLAGARLLAYRAAWLIDQGHDDLAAAAMAKLAMSESIVAAAEDVTRLLAGRAWGGRSLDMASAIADTLGGLFASGTSEIQLELVARHLQSERPLP